MAVAGRHHQLPIGPMRRKDPVVRLYSLHPTHSPNRWQLLRLSGSNASTFVTSSTSSNSGKSLGTIGVQMPQDRWWQSPPPSQGDILVISPKTESRLRTDLFRNGAVKSSYLLRSATIFHPENYDPQGLKAWDVTGQLLAVQMRGARESGHELTSINIQNVEGTNPPLPQLREGSQDFVLHSCLGDGLMWRHRLIFFNRHCNYSKYWHMTESHNVVEVLGILKLGTAKDPDFQLQRFQRSVLDGVDIPDGHYKLCTHGICYISDHKTREIEGAIGMGEPSSRAFGPMKPEFSDRYALHSRIQINGEATISEQRRDGRRQQRSRMAHVRIERAFVHRRNGRKPTGARTQYLAKEVRLGTVPCECTAYEGTGSKIEVTARVVRIYNVVNGIVPEFLCKDGGCWAWRKGHVLAIMLTVHNIGKYPPTKTFEVQHSLSLSIKTPFTLPLLLLETVTMPSHPRTRQGGQVVEPKSMDVVVWQLSKRAMIFINSNDADSTNKGSHSIRRSILTPGPETAANQATDITLLLFKRNEVRSPNGS
ncbi:hypothetical protein B0H13DRAFT_1871616 [Mycena leptocephala]|nr:hypothetical protein B0H13DRAFT_1871616 [Mycena leptocephala]